MRYALIMAGGSGTRLWPMSTKTQPKQLIPLLAGRSLLEASVQRLDGLVEPDRQYIATNASLCRAIRSRLPRFDDAHLIGEPAQRDTLNAVGLAAAVIGKADPDAVIVVLTADHIVKPVDLFQERVRLAFDIIERQPQTLVTFGIQPTEPSSAYGYVHLGPPLDGFDHSHQVLAFREKPDPQTARQYLASGDYRWNSGMFVWRAQTLLDNICRFQRQAHAGLMKIRDAWGTAEQQAILEAEYPRLPKISVDYAVMEPVSRQGHVATVDLPVDWIDVGSWTSYAEVCPTDSAGNALGAKHALLRQTSRCVVASAQDDHLIATIGLEDLIIIHSPRATLVCRKSDEQAIKQLQADICEKYGDRFV